MTTRELARQHLGLTLPCTLEALQHAYRAAVKRCHPDVGGTSKQFVELRAAYDQIRRDPMSFDDIGEGSRKTIDGTLLAELGQGLGPTVNGRQCGECSGRGWTTYRDEITRPCPECLKVAFRPRHFTWCRRCYGSGTVVAGHVIRYQKCFRCHGVGEIALFNPVFPKGRLT